MPHQIKVTDELYDQLKEKAGARPIPALLRELLAATSTHNTHNTSNTPAQVDLVDQLDAAAEQIDPLIADLPAGELPPCCQTIFDDPEHPTPTCPHWKKAWVNHYGNRIVHYKNTLTGGSYFDYFNKYVGA